ncbi:MAG TPA: DUF3857 domain-containing protein [Thermoanaerobaculia bacterium]|nr:DUF3857 domain-containing protein [Thermoanaerobaculia bacterium]
MSNELGANPDLRPERPRPGPRRWPRRLAALAAALAAAPAPAALTLAAAIAALPASAAPPLAAAIVAVLLPTACALAAAAEPAAAIPAPAEEPWDGRFFAAPPPELLAAATAATTAQAKAEAELPVSVLFAEHIYSFDDAGRLSRTHRLVYRMQGTTAGPSWSQVHVSWLPWYQQTPRLRARVVTPDGQEHQLDPKVLERSTVGGPDAETFAERQRLRGPLPATGAGAVIEEEETVVDATPPFDRGTFERHVLAMNVPVRHLRVVLEAPADMNLRYALELLPGLTPRREPLPGRQRLVFEARDLPARAHLPAGLPPEAPRWPAIAFANAASWRDVAEKYSRIVDQAVAGAPLAAWLQAAHAYAPAASQLDVIERLLAHMADIRYAAVELGEGGIVPRPPAETLGRRFGDCKDKAVLLAAALRALDVPAYVALLEAGQAERDVDPELPGFGAFDHAIVYVPGTPALWIDPTDRYARAGELPVSDQGRYALVAAPGIAGLVRTPAASSAENRIQKTREFFLADSGPARVVETLEYAGTAEQLLRTRLAATTAAALRQEGDDYARDTFRGKTANPFASSDPQDLSRPLSRRLEVSAAGRAYTDPATAVVAAFYTELFDLLPADLTAEHKENDSKPATGEDAEPRRLDYWFRLPHTVEVRYRVVPPAGYEPEDLPTSRVRRLGTATLAEQYAAGERGIVTATLRFDSGRQRISAAELAALHSALVQLKKERPVLLRFRQVGEAQAAAGHIREALLEFRNEAAAAPTRALPHQRLARALLAGGLGEAAWREAERAVAIEPRSAAAWSTFGWVLQHDAIGRRFGPGFARQRALAAYVKAKQLDPALATTRIDYAILLEHDDQGQRFAAGADLKAAIAEYQAVRKDDDIHTYDENLLIDLVYAGRHAEALELAATMKDTETKRTAVTVATAMTGGAEAAIHEVERTTDEPARQLPILQSAAQTLLRLRACAAAAALLERAAPLSPTASEILARAAMLRQVRPLDQIPLPAGEPSTVARRLFLAFAHGDADPKALIGLVSKSVLAAEAAHDGQSTDLSWIGKALRRQLAKEGGLPLDLVFELFFAAAKETTSGDDALGYRIDYHIPFLDEDIQCFVVREGGDYRIAGVSTMPAMLGMEALRRLGVGDLPGARQWLDWARELTKDPAGELPAPPFAVLWARGVAAGAEPARCAAAALAVSASDAATVAPVLRACRAAETVADRQLALDLALAIAAGEQQQWDEAIELARRLAAARPGAALPFLLEGGALQKLGRVGAIVELAQRRLERLPGDRQARLALAQTARKQGDFDGAERVYRLLAESTGAAAEELNGLAWLLLVRGRADQEAVELARRATQRPDGKTHDVLHTLAALLAESDRPAEAYQAMVQALAAADEPEPGSVDWYVFGRIAEQYGLPEVARGLFARVERPVPDDAGTTWRLARARLAVLDGKAPAPAAAKSTKH